MIYSPNDLLKLILDTHAVSIWNRASGPVFWYAANVPGPFYVNTEMVIGKALSERLLREITAIIAGTVDAQARAEQLNRLIMDAYKGAPAWQRLIATMVDHARKDFPKNSFAMVSGGERRDWLFSIPFAHALDVPHLYLFKNGTMFSSPAPKAGLTVLHVSDLINNAASILEVWLPVLQKAQIKCCGQVCVNVRGENGLHRLKEAGQKVVALMTIDIDFFRRLHASDLIARETFEELAVFFSSAQDWAAKYLINKPEVFDVKGSDPKTFERLKFFITRDPWKIRPQYEAFFATMQKAIEERAKAKK